MNEACIFCEVNSSRFFLENNKCIAMLDKFPVSPGHTLLITKRHVESIFDLHKKELSSLLALMSEARNFLIKEYSPDGFNIGVNDGSIAGQTILHFHMHLIPRYKNDQEDPRGGIRLIFPKKAKYFDQ